MGKKEVALIGAGKIGKGYIADLFSKAGYKMYFLCHSLRQAKELREQGYYTVFKFTGNDGQISQYRIEGFEAYSTEEEFSQCADVLCKVSYATVHVYKNAFEDVSRLLAEAVKRRVSNGIHDTLDVILCINYRDTDLIFSEYIRGFLDSQEEMDYFDKYVGIGMALTFRLGTDPNEEMLSVDRNCVCVAESPDLPVDREAFKGEIPEGVALRPLSGMRERMIYKLWCGNVRGAITSCIALKKGYVYTADAIRDNEVYIATVLGTREAQFGFDQEFKLSDEAKAETFSSRRSGSEEKKSGLGRHIDTCARVAADPVRKLARRDRLTGPALGVIKGGRIPFFLSRAIACYFYYYNENDPGTVTVQDYIKKNGISKAVERFCELDLSDDTDRTLHELVLSQYYDMYDKEIDSINELLT
ncbi:MAG: hypothetical protein II749_03360 [Clostridia bacterium]|nr:hypothetical protein [Clostridia bacterium]